MATSSTSGVTIDDLKAKHGQLRSEHASLQTQLESLRQLPADATIDAVHTALELDNDELGRELREIEERAILYRSLAWTCFELDLDVGRRARAARRGDGAAAPVDKDGNLGFGVRLDTFWNGRFYEPYYLVLARPSQLLETSRLASTTTGDAEPASLSDELRLIRHTVPHFIPLERLVEKYLPSVLGGGMSGGSASRSRDSGAGGLTMLAQFSQLPGINAFLSDLHCHLQAYVSRRQQAASLQRLRLPGSSGAGPDQRPSLEALGTEAFDLIKITWHLPSPRQLDEAPAQTGQQVTDADAAASSLGATKRKRGLVDRDESAKSLVVTVGFSDLQSERLVDERRPKGILPNASGGGGGGGGGGDGGGTDPDGSPPDPVQGSKLPYGQVRIEILEYPPEAETRERRSAGISHADILALEPRSTRRQDLEVQFAEQHDGESSDLDKAFQHIAASVWRQESGSASELAVTTASVWDAARNIALTLVGERIRPRVDPQIYRKKSPDFRHLASLYPDSFGKYVRDDGGFEAKLDFQDPNAVRSLGETLLKHDFGVDAVLSPSNLCPMIPNRLSYIALIHEVLLHSLLGWELIQTGGLQELQAEKDSHRSQRTRIVGLDIGTGASAIYPLLACACFPHWCMTGTDIAESSLDYAHRHIVSPHRNQATLANRSAAAGQGEAAVAVAVAVSADLGAGRGRGRGRGLGLDKRIRLYMSSSRVDALTHVPPPAFGMDRAEREAADSPSPTPPPPSQEDIEFHFTMCNPPFYASQEEMAHCADFKAGPPNAVCHGTAGEMVTPGGEVEFISRMIDESASAWHEPPSAPIHADDDDNLDTDHRGKQPQQNPKARSPSRAIWYTSMVGKLGSLVPLVQRIKTHMRAGDGCSWGFCELRHGSGSGRGRTRRWVLLWTWTGLRLPNHLSRSVKSHVVQHCLPSSTERVVTLTPRLGPLITRREVLAAAYDILCGMDGCTVFPSSTSLFRTRDRTRTRGADGVGEETGSLDALLSVDSWTRRYRRQQQQQTSSSQHSALKRPNPLMITRISVRERERNQDDASEGAGLEVKISWIWGRDRVQFESFAMSLVGSIERKLASHRSHTTAASATDDIAL